MRLTDSHTHAYTVRRRAKGWAEFIVLQEHQMRDKGFASKRSKRGSFCCSPNNLANSLLTHEYKFFLLTPHLYNIVMRLSYWTSEFILPSLISDCCREMDRLRGMQISLLSPQRNKVKHPLNGDRNVLRKRRQNSVTATQGRQFSWFVPPNKTPVSVQGKSTTVISAVNSSQCCSVPFFFFEV